MPKIFPVADELPFESVSLFSFLSRPIARNYGERFIAHKLAAKWLWLVAGLIMA